MTQLSFPDPPTTRHTDPVTSHLAAADVRPSAGYGRSLALKTLNAHPDGLTDFELAALTGLQQTSIGKRRGELRDAGLVVDSGRKRPAPSGSKAIVWVAASAYLPSGCQKNDWPLSPKT